MLINVTDSRVFLGFKNYNTVLLYNLLIEITLFYGSKSKIIHSEINKSHYSRIAHYYSKKAHIILMYQ